MANNLQEIENLRTEVQKLKDENVKLRRTLEDTLNNIDFDNLSPECVSLINKPVYSKIEDTNGNVAELALTAEGLATRITSAEGNISTLTLTASGLTTRISDAEGNISSLQITSSSLNTRISSAEGNISSLALTASSLSARVTSAEGSISSLTLKVNGLQLSVANGSTSSTISLTSGGITLSSANITFTGVVTFTSMNSALSTAGATTINGANIMTGTISSSKLAKNPANSYIEFNSNLYFAPPANSIAGLDELIFNDRMYIYESGGMLTLYSYNGVNITGGGLYVNGAKVV